MVQAARDASIREVRPVPFDVSIESGSRPLGVVAQER
jgi:hypothetical protein